MTVSVKVSNDTIKRISKTNTLLDMLVNFEKTLDDMDLYAFANWIEGEVLVGPILKRHYVVVKLMYKNDQMPDPEGAERLMSRGCMVQYKKDTLITPVDVKSYNDVEVHEAPDGKIKYKAKKQEEPIWIVTIEMPRRFVDDFKTDVIEADEDEFVDSENLNVESEIDSQSQMGGNSDDFGEFGADEEFGGDF